MTNTSPTLIDIFKEIADEIYLVGGRPNEFTLILEADMDSINRVAARLGYLKQSISPWSMPEARIYEAHCYGMAILLRVKE